ncbi:MAG: DinB family protein [Chitinophagaceae bacterium]|nr:DinB family protein [Chitinophagaceae bacterium]
MDQKKLFIKMVIMSWETQNTRVNKLLEELSDEQLSAETAPGRNRGIYLLGHLVAVSDGIIPLLGLGEKKYPELEKIFVTTADKSELQLPSVAELKECWNDVNSSLSHYFNQMDPDEWFYKHSSVSQVDFAKEPYRNKLNILINRTNHQSYHLGQLIYLKTLN